MALPRKVPLTDTPRHLTHPEEYTLTTRELAELVGVEPEVPSRRYLAAGHWFGYIPLKINTRGDCRWHPETPTNFLKRFKLQKEKYKGRPTYDDNFRSSVFRAGAIL